VWTKSRHFCDTGDESGCKKRKEERRKRDFDL